MKLNWILLFHIPLVVFSLQSHKKIILQDHLVTVVPGDTTTQKWIDDFKNFRDAVYRSDTGKIKTWFDFPLTGNDIWYLVLTEKEVEKQNGNFKQFTEKDFNKYYKKIFPKQFVQSLLKIKSAELLKKGRAESPDLKEGNTNIKMYVSVDKEENTLQLNLAYNTPWKEKDGDVIDGGESNVLYTFKIIDNRSIRFLRIQLAG